MLAGTRTGGPSVLAEADGGDHIGKVGCRPRLTVVFRDVNLSPETDGGTTACGIEVPGVDVAREPFGQTLFAADERGPEPCPVHGASFGERPVRRRNVGRPAVEAHRPQIVVVESLGAPPPRIATVFAPADSNSRGHRYRSVRRPHLVHFGLRF